MSFNFVIPEINIGGGTGTPTLQFFRKGFNLGGSVEPTWQDIILSGNTALTLVNAKQDGLNYLKLFGGTELLPEQYLDTVTLSGGCEQRAPNLYNSATSEIGYTLTDTGRTATGALGLVSAYIPVQPNTSYTLKFTRTAQEIYTRVCSYSSASESDFLSLLVKNTTVTAGDITATFTTDATAQYIRVSFKKDSTNVSLSYDVSVPTPQQPFDIVCNNGVVKVSPNVAVLSSNTMSSPITNIDITTGTFNVSVSKSNTSSQITSSLATLCPNLKEGDTVYFHFNSEPTGNMYLGGYGNGIQINSDSSLTITSTHLSTQLRFGGGDSSIVRTFAITNFYIGKEPYSSFSSYPAYGDIYTDGTQEVVTDSVGNTASAEMLLAVGDYKDTQEILSGVVTRNVGIKVFDGSEDWGYSELASLNYFTLIISDLPTTPNFPIMSNHFVYNNGATDNSIHTQTTTRVLRIRCDRFTSITDFKAFLASQYSSGNPVVIVYPLATATTSTVSGQFLSKSPVTQTAGSISGLPIAITESSHTTPTPTQPLDIRCNNGVVKTTAPLPQSYTALEYIESTGTQYINSNVSYASGDSLRAVADMQFTNITSSQFFGIYASAYCGINGNRFVIGGYGVITANTNRHIFDLYSDIEGTNTVTLEIDGTPYTYSRNTNSGQFVILGLNGVNICSAKLYSIKLYKNDNLVFDGIPAKRNSDSVIGMYDAVSQTFFTNAGTGAFTTGSELPFIYADGTQETVEVHSKNLLGIPVSTETASFDVNTGTITNTATDTRSPLQFIIRFLNANQGFISNAYTTSISGEQKISAVFTTTSDTYFIRLLNNGSVINPASAIWTVKPNTTYRLAFDVTGADPTTIGGIVYSNMQLTLGSTETDYVPYFNGGSANAEMLLSVGNYKDVQSVLDGNITRNVGIKVLNGTEEWTQSGTSTSTKLILYMSLGSQPAISENCRFMSTHYPQGDSGSNLGFYTSNPTNIFINLLDTFSSVADFKTYLASQYNAGTPVIVVYPISSPTTETVTPQPLTTKAGTNIVEITQASIDNLGLEVSYKAGVRVTITEVQNAQLSNQVTVTIGG